MYELLLNWTRVLRNYDRGKSMFFKVQAAQEQFAYFHNDQLGMLYHANIALHEHLFGSTSLRDKALQKAAALLSSKNITSEQKYFYFMAQCNIEYTKGKYENSLEWIIQAEVYLSSIKDELELSAFYYRLASVYYYTEETVKSIRSIEKCINLYETNVYVNMESPSNKIAEYKLIQALNLIDLKQHVEAEELLLEALSIAKKLDDQKLIALSYHNLAFLYSDQCQSTTALKYIRKALELQEYHLDQAKLRFLFTKELLMNGSIEEAKNHCYRGLAETIENDNMIYHYKYVILNELYLQDQADDETLQSAITYFTEKERWIDQEEYADLIASYHNERQDFEKASKYFYFSLQARHKIKKRMD